MSEETLLETARKIENAYVELVNHILEFTDKELNEFSQYLSRQETIGPMFNPTFFAHQGGFKMVDEAKKRCELIQYCRRVILPKRGE